jgi:hypothetical protein
VHYKHGLIASRYVLTQVEQLVRRHPGTKLYSLEWIIQSFKARKLLDPEDFVLCSDFMRQCSKEHSAAVATAPSRAGAQVSDASMHVISINVELPRGMLAPF